MNKINVLITGSGSIYGVAIIQSLLKSTLNVRLVACDTHPHAYGLHIAHRSYIVPPAKEEQSYLNRLIEILQKEKIQAVFIGSSQELPFFSQYKAWIESKTGSKVFTNSEKVFAICNDKWHTIQFLQEHHFPYPKTIRYPEDQEQIHSFMKEVGYPLIVKPRCGKGSEDIHVVHNMSHLLQVLTNKTEMILQQYLPDDQEEYTVGVCSGTAGNVLSSVALKRQLQDGMTMVATSDEYKIISDYCKLVARALKPYGPCNFQLRLWKEQPYIFEINPRFSSSTGMRTLLGVNEPEILLQAELLQKKITEPKIKRAGVIRQYTDYIVPLEQILQLEKEKYATIEDESK